MGDLARSNKEESDLAALEMKEEIFKDFEDLDLKVEEAIEKLTEKVEKEK